MLANALAGFAQEMEVFWDHGIGKLLKSADDYVRQREQRGFDTNYVKVPEQDKMVFIGTNMVNQQYDVHIPISVLPGDFPGFMQRYLPSNISDLMYTEPRFRATKVGVQLGINWRGISVAVPLPLSSSYSKAYSLASNGRTWGFRVNYRTVKNVTGTIMDPFEQTGRSIAEKMLADYESGGELGEDHEPFFPKEHDIEDGSMDLRTLYAETYYVFNNRKFSIAAGLSGNKMQKRSAGSFIAMMNYFQSSLGCNNMLAAERDVLRNQIFSAGIGYGYNLSLLKGRICLHASVIPMLSVYNRITHELTNPEEEIKDDNYDSEFEEMMAEMFKPYHLHFYDAIDNHRYSQLKLNGFARVSVNYFFDRYLLSVLLHYRRNMFGNSSGLTMDNQDADLRIRLGYRF